MLIYGFANRIPLANLPPVVHIGRSDCSPSDSNAYRRSIRLPCDLLGERSPSPANDTARQENPGMGANEEKGVPYEGMA